MNKLWAGFSALNLVWKIIIAALILFVIFWVTDSFHGGMEKLRKLRYDRNETENMQKVLVLEKENEEIRRTNAALRENFNNSEKRALEAEMKNEIFEARMEQLGAAAAAEQLKAQRVLEELDREEAITQQPTDNFTRCTRGRTKLIEKGIKSAANINCDQYTRRPAA